MQQAWVGVVSLKIPLQPPLVKGRIKKTKKRMKKRQKRGWRKKKKGMSERDLQRWYLIEIVNGGRITLKDASEKMDVSRPALRAGSPMKKKDAEAEKIGLRKIYTAENIVKARKAVGEFTRKWENAYPKAIKCLRDDIDDLLVFFRFKSPEWRKATRTTNAIERRFREVRRRTRPMGVFSDKTSIERILFAVFTYENKKQGTAAPFLMTQNT